MNLKLSLSKIGIRPRWENTTVRTLGILEVVFALLLLVPAGVALFLGEDARVFAAPVLPLLVAGGLQYMLFKESSTFRSVNGLVLIGLVWLVMFLISALPFLFSGMDLVDSLFEAVSGITTTGLSIIPDVEAQPMSLLIWRAMSMWMGGIMIIIVFLYMLPLFGIGRNVFTNELSGSGSSNYSMKMRNAAKSFIYSYLLLSLINLVLLLVFGMDPLEAFCLMCTTISTGGLMCTNDSMMSYSDAIQLIDGLGLAAEETADKAGTTFSELKEQLEELVQGGPLEVIADLADALRSGDWSGAASAIAQGLWLTITPEQQDIIYNWATEAVKAMNDGFAKAGWSGLADAGASVVQGLMDSGTDMGGLITGLLNQVGISGGVEGLLGVLSELAPLVLGVAASAAAVAAGVMGVAAAFKYVISQSQLLQDKVQELTDAGQTLTDELAAALDVLQPVIDLSREMLASLDRVTSTITDTLTGIGVELMESLLPVLTEIMDTLAPVAESLQPALEAAGDLLRTVLELFGTLASSALTALQPVLEAVGPLLETLALRLNTIATLVANFLSPVLKVLGEVLNWLLQPILWVADAIQAAVTFVVDLLNSVLGFLGLKTIDLPDGSAALKGEAFDKVTNALEDNTEAIQEQTDLIRNPPRYQTGGGGPSTGVTDYSAMLAAARAAVLAQNTRAVTNYDAGSGQTTARLNASWKGTSTTVLNLDGREVARAVTPYVDEDMAF